MASFGQKHGLITCRKIILEQSGWEELNNIAQKISKFNWFRIKLVQIQGLLRYFPRGMF